MHREGLALELEPPGEREATQKIIDLLKQRLEREYPPPERTLRDAHPKQHGLVRAQFIVEPNLRADLRIGLFAEPRTYPAWVRFSNMSDPPGPDSAPDSRGMAIKVMGVQGEKILEDERHATTQDFVLMSTSFFVTKDVAQFANLVAALEGGKLRLIWHMLSHPYLLLLFFRVRRRCASVLEIGYGSTTPYLFGTRAVKYFVRPLLPATSVIPDNPSHDFLREQMVRHLSTNDASFQFLIQLQTDARKMPIEDPRVIWSEELSPLETVATLRIPAQQFDTPAQRDYGDNLSFTPWHSLPAHRPLGGINRARRAIYDTMSRFRHARNSAPRDEPSGWVDF
jgi:hypothetical protein